MRLDETIVWRLSYANTPLHVIHTNNNINKNNKNTNIDNKQNEQRVRSQSFISWIVCPTTNRNERKKKYFSVESNISAIHTERDLY